MTNIGDPGLRRFGYLAPVVNTGRRILLFDGRPTKLDAGTTPAHTSGRVSIIPFDLYSTFTIIDTSHWAIEVTGSFERWLGTLNSGARVRVAAKVELLRRLGPDLPFPHSSGIKGSRHAHMRELRIEHKGRQLRALCAFDPNRTAVLLLGGDKTGDDRFYERLVPLADDLYRQHLDELGS